MRQSIHAEILAAAVGDVFSPRALAQITAANLYQDRIRGQIGHPEYHFDDNAFERSQAYLEEQRLLTLSSLRTKDVVSAWSAFGRLTHTAQDFYAHSNYIELWLARQPEEARPAPAEVDPVAPGLLRADALRSGRIYLLDYLTFFRLLKPLITPWLPRDSHGRMNLDSPERGPKFQYAFHAAVKRTKIEFEKTIRDLPEESYGLFVDQ